MSDTRIIALAGKGGVGKTSISAALVRLLAEARPEAKILAIDADPAVGLSTALGLEVTATLNDIRQQFIELTEQGRARNAVDMLGEVRYRIFDILTEKAGFSFLAIGRPESAGCYCSVNAYLKEVIRMVSGSFDYVVIDGEAGIEQINRRVMEKVTHLIVVTDPSRKGTQVVNTILDVARELVQPERCGVILNRVLQPELAGCIRTEGAELLALIGSDEDHAANDVQGKSIFELPEGSPILKGAAEALAKLGLM